MAILSVVPIAHAQSTSWSFNLIGRNNVSMCMVASCFGDFGTLTGSGSFVTSGDCTPTVSGGVITGGGCTVDSIIAGGSYTVTDPSGKVLDRGTWTATSASKFYSYGGPSAGLQGGHLIETLSHISSFTGATKTNIAATVNCLIGQSHLGITATGTFEEGTTEGRFTMIMTGMTLFHLDS